MRPTIGFGAALALGIAATIAPPAEPAPTPEPAPSGVAAIAARHDRALVADLTAYIASDPKADDIEQAYMTVFDKAIQHDWFAEHDAIARRYLDERPEGSVRPLAQIVATMARAQAGRFDEAYAAFETLMAGVSGPEQQEFAVNFAENLAGSATTAGSYPVARKVYESLRAKYPDDPNLLQSVRDAIARLDKVGRAVPDVAGVDLAGAPIRLADLKGKYVLVDFWATWCAPCVAEIPRLQSAYAKYRARGFEIVAVSLDETKAPVLDFVAARKIPWKQVHNAAGGADLVEAFGVTNIPATFLIDPSGTIIRLELRGPALDEALAKLIK